MFHVRYDYVFEYNMITMVRVYLHFCSDASSTRKVSHLVPVQVSTGSVDDHPQPLNAFKAICTVFGVGQGGARMPVPGLPRGNLVAGGCRQGGRERVRVSEQTRTAVRSRGVVLRNGCSLLLEDLAQICVRGKGGK